LPTPNLGFDGVATRQSIGYRVLVNYFSITEPALSITLTIKFGT
jgi:hypothetical protein